jgi:uncharacterized membrane protein
MLNMVKKIIWIILLILLIDTVLAATIHGTVYDLTLEKQSNAIVTIDTAPKQTYVAKDGTYSFDLPVGEYNIEAKYVRDDEVISITNESVSVKDEGDYVVDLILFPSFEEEEELLSETDLEVADPLEEINYLAYIIFGVFGIIIFGLSVFIYLKYKKSLTKIKKDIEETVKAKDVLAESKKVLDFIKQEGGRTTQKDIRSKFPSSEAKISLIITELEHKGIIKKIKKGRGNIIVLK